jgi:hypothetical protein
LIPIKSSSAWQLDKISHFFIVSRFLALNVCYELQYLVYIDVLVFYIRYLYIKMTISEVITEILNCSIKLYSLFWNNLSMLFAWKIYVLDLFIVCLQIPTFFIIYSRQFLLQVKLKYVIGHCVFFKNGQVYLSNSLGLL